MIKTLSFPAVGHRDIPLAAEQSLRRSHDYQMRLVRICREYREKYQALVREAFPDLGAAAARVEELDAKAEALAEQVKTQRKAMRTGRARVPPELAQVRADLKAACAVLKDIRDRLRGSPEMKAATAQLTADEQAAYKEARAQCGLPAAIYITAEENFRRAKKMAGAEGPSFRSYDGSGRLAVQVQAVGGADRLLYAALAAADLHVSAAQVLRDAGRIKLIMGRPFYVADDGKRMALAEGLRLWREGEGAAYRGHNAEDADDAANQLAPIRTLKDLGSGKIAAARIVWLSRQEWAPVAYPGEDVPRPQPGSRRERDNAYGVLYLRVSREGDELTLPFRVAKDRLPPPESQVKWVYVHRQRIGERETAPPREGVEERIALGRYQWRVLLTVDDPSPRPAARPGVVAVNFGWRARPEGNVRVAYWLGDDGAQGEVVVDAALVSGIQKADELRSLNDQLFEVAKGRLGAYLATLPEWPAWVEEAAKGLPQWRSGGRLAKFISLWRDNRLPGDEEVFTALAGPVWEPVVSKDGTPQRDREGKPKLRDTCWLRTWRHLRAWETAQREKMLTRRREHFRHVGKMLSERYGTLLIEDFNLSEQRRKLPVEEGTAKEKTPLVRQMNFAAPGLLRDIVRSSFAHRGGREEVETLPLATQRCATCGNEERWDAAKSVLHSCEKCGATAVDQDWQNCQNRLMHRAAQREKAA